MTIQKNEAVKKEIFLVFIMLILLCGGTWLFVHQVSSQLWEQSMQSMNESIHQGVNALNMQLEMDFGEIKAIGENLKQFDCGTLIQVMDLYRAVRKDVMIYLNGKETLDERRKPDLAVTGYLPQEGKGQGMLDAHNSSVTGENVFNIYYRFVLADGTPAYLVKEYQAKEIAAQFTPSFYEYSGFSYLVNQDGDIMVRPRHTNSNMTVQNLFELIPEDENDKNEILRFQNNISGLSKGWARFYDDGTGLVFCYESIWANSSWMLVAIVPEANILAQTNSILAKTFLFAAFQVLLVLTAFVIFYKAKMQENKVHTQELEQALQAADAASNAKGMFLMNMSHDIRTPLNAVIGLTAVAQKQMDHKEQLRRNLEKINASGRYLLNLVNDVMDMSQIENGKMILKEESVRIGAVFADVAKMMAYRVQEAGLSMETVPVRLAQDTVLADPMRIRQIMVNIIDNAVKYTPAGGSILLRLEQTKDAREGYAVYHFSCSDTGIGMDQAFLKKVFQPFERGRNTTASGIAGTGVGLAITKGLLELMGGSILAESEPGKGTVFTAVFPLQTLQETQHGICRIHTVAAPDTAKNFMQQEPEGVVVTPDMAKNHSQQEPEGVVVTPDMAKNHSQQEPEGVVAAPDTAKKFMQQEPEGVVPPDVKPEASEAAPEADQPHVFLLEATEEGAVQEAEEGKEEQGENTDYSDKRVLLVEDVELNMEIAEAMIGMTGVQIEKAYDGQEAVQMVEQKPGGYYNLIFMDIQMPVMDGYEATKRIRAMARPDAAQIPIYALSANALAEDVEHSMQAGMNGHIAKPIDMEPIEKVMRQYLS